jgi:hypothetical protein
LSSLLGAAAGLLNSFLGAAAAWEQQFARKEVDEAVFL